MSGLFAWLQELIGLVLFASLVELLLPEGSLRKYARLVLSLMVLLALLGPIATALHRPWTSEEDLFRRMDDILRPTSGISHTFPSPSGVSPAFSSRLTSDAASSNERFRQEVFREAERRIALAVAADLAAAGFPTVDRVDVRLGGSLTHPEVVEVLVYFAAGPRTPKKDEPGHVTVAVPPVMVSLDRSSPVKEDLRSSRESKMTTVPPLREGDPEGRELAEKVVTHLTQRFGFPAEVVRVAIERAKE